jgi:hypothetical protein
VARLADESLLEEDTQWLLGENRPVELLTFLFSLWAAFRGFKLVRKLRSNNDLVVVLFYLCFSLSMFFLAMEEISRGQQFLKFDWFSLYLVQ